MNENTSSHIEVQVYCNLYIVKSSIDEGNVNIAPSAKWYVGNVPYGSGEKIRVYICPGVTLTILPQFASNLQSNVEYYVCPGAQLICDANFKMNGTALYVAPGATATLQSLEVNNTGLTYNQGTITTEGKIYIANNVSVLVNDGSITAGSASAPTELEIAGGGRVQNNAEMNIYGDTFVSSNSAMWVNNGHWTTTYYTYIAGSFNVINNCYLEVREDFRMNLGDGQGSFRMDSGAGVVAKNYLAEGPGYIYMGANSVFKVTETATMDHSKVNYGIYGPENGGYAVFQAKNIVKGKEGQGFEVTYGNNLYVSAESHFAQGNDGQADHPFIDIKGNAKIYAPSFEDGLPAITINETTCNPGFIGSGSGGGGETVKPVTESIRVIAEDLSAEDRSDFDFNDVVFDVFWTHTPGNDDKSTQSVKLKIYAAGGELPLFIGYADNPEWEIHTLLEAVNPNRGITTKTMMNTYENQHHAYNYREVDLPNDAWEGSEIGPIAKSINIFVRKSGKTYPLTAEKGEAACKIAVLQSFDPWCDEWEDINKRHQFSKYVTGELGDDEWY